MEANSSDDDHDDHQLLVDNTNIDQQQQQQHVVINNIIRFKCSFCGRGFSNAQALGGHMNVHRRDRAAKFNINNPSSSSDPTQHDQSQLLLPWNIIFSPRQDQEYCHEDQQEEEQDNEIHVKQQYYKPQQLPLFVDTALPSRLVTSNDDNHDHVIIAKTHESPSSHGHDLAEGDDKELDLELRLGPDRPGDSTGGGTMSTMSTNTGTASSTRGFF